MFFIDFRGSGGILGLGKSRKLDQKTLREAKRGGQLGGADRHHSHTLTQNIPLTCPSGSLGVSYPGSIVIAPVSAMLQRAFSTKKLRENFVVMVRGKSGQLWKCLDRDYLSVFAYFFCGAGGFFGGCVGVEGGSERSIT